MQENKLQCEEEIVQRLRQNDGSVFEILYKVYWNNLLNYASKYTKDAFVCQELVQELFVQLLTGGSGLIINSSLSAYLYVAIRNKAFNHLRNQALYEKHITTAGKTALPSSSNNNNVQQAIDLMELQREINMSLDHMPEKYKEVYILHDQFTIRQISEILNRPVHTVQKQLRKAVYLLRDHLIMIELAT